MFEVLVAVHWPRLRNSTNREEKWIKTLKYHVSCNDGNISVRINLLFYLFFTVVPSYDVCFFPVSFPSLCNIFKTSCGCWSFFYLLAWAVDSWSLNHEYCNCWFPNFVCCLVWAVYLGVQITLPKPGDRRNFNTHKTYSKCCINNERPTERNTQVLDGTTVKNR